MVDEEPSLWRRIVIALCTQRGCLFLVVVERRSSVSLSVSLFSPGWNCCDRWSVPRNCWPWCGFASSTRPGSSQTPPKTFRLDPIFWLRLYPLSLCPYLYLSSVTCLCLVPLPSSSVCVSVLCFFHQSLSLSQSTSPVLGLCLCLCLNPLCPSLSLLPSSILCLCLYFCRRPRVCWCQRPCVMLTVAENGHTHTHTHIQIYDVHIRTHHSSTAIQP